MPAAAAAAPVRTTFHGLSAERELLSWKHNNPFGLLHVYEDDLDGVGGEPV